MARDDVLQEHRCDIKTSAGAQTPNLNKKPKKKRYLENNNLTKKTWQPIDASDHPLPPAWRMPPPPLFAAVYPNPTDRVPDLPIPCLHRRNRRRVRMDAVFLGGRPILSQLFASRRGHEHRLSFHAQRQPGRSPPFPPPMCGLPLPVRCCIPSLGGNPDDVDIVGIVTNGRAVEKKEGRQPTPLSRLSCPASHPPAWESFDMQPCRPDISRIEPIRPISKPRGRLNPLLDHMRCAFTPPHPVMAGSERSIHARHHVGNTDPTWHLYLGLHCEPGQRNRRRLVAQDRLHGCSWLWAHPSRLRRRFSSCDKTSGVVSCPRRLCMLMEIHVPEPVTLHIYDLLRDATGGRNRATVARRCANPQIVFAGAVVTYQKLSNHLCPGQSCLFPPTNQR